MIEKIVSFIDGSWVLDPSKISASGLMATVIADRAGPEEIKKIIDKTHLSDGHWKYSYQNGVKLELRHIENLLEDFSEVGSEYYLNQFVELGDSLMLWLPEFSEFSVLVFRKEMHTNLSEVLGEFNEDLEDWISSDFWTEKERQFICDGRDRYTVTPIS